ncbi:MAG: hypothetical protein NTW95_13980 [Candidatus Aminicenantes bacterium]|nr:hypothetical protein [Candidatus Aminicenantes bacterium]
MPPSLVLVPYFTEKSHFASLQKRALQRQDFLHSSLLWFDNMALISGFLGYPHLLTLLALVDGLPDKEIYFLGSAGAIRPRFKEPAALQVGEIRPGSVFKRFSTSRSLLLKVFPDAQARFPVVCGVSVDIIQRETKGWLAAQRAMRTDIVEMELFPLRWFLRKPFHALVVLSDRVEPTGIRPFADKQKFQREFAAAFDYIVRQITHG